MLNKDKQDVSAYSNGVRLHKDVIELVRKHKEKTGIPIGRFVEDAIREKLKKSK